MTDQTYTLATWAITTAGSPPEYYVIERQPPAREATQWGPMPSREIAEKLIGERRAMFEEMVADKIGDKPLPKLKPAAGDLMVECPRCHQQVSETCCAYQDYDYYKDCYHFITRPNRKEDEETIERAAADLWLKENPGMSVFACDAEMKERYRQRARASVEQQERKP